MRRRYLNPDGRGEPHAQVEFPAQTFLPLAAKADEEHSGGRQQDEQQRLAAVDPGSDHVQIVLGGFRPVQRAEKKMVFEQVENYHARRLLQQPDYRQERDRAA